MLGGTVADSSSELTGDEKLLLMRYIKRIAALYDECTGDDLQDISDFHREDGPNPIFGRTLNGLFLEFYYGGPYRLWTPWGAWLFAAAPTEETDIQAFMGRLTVWMHIPGNNYSDGSPISPVYGIQVVEDQILPTAVCVADEDRSYYTTVDLRAEWKLFYESC